MSDHAWDLLEVDEVTEVIRQAATKVARHFDTEVDDLIQEGNIRVVTVESLTAAAFRGDYGNLAYWLEQDLVNIATSEKRHDNRSTSLEERYDDFGAEPSGVVQIRTEVSGYTKELVESLLPAIWDDSYCYGVRAENAPDPDMPRGTINKATGNAVGAHIADIKRAWDGAGLTFRERQALFATFGSDWTQQHAASVIGVNQQNVSDWKVAGVNRIVGWLNGRAVAA